MSEFPDRGVDARALGDPSPWFASHVGLLPRAGRAVDVASGAGRHARWLAGLGLDVVAVDRDRDALDRIGSGTRGSITPLCADLESAGWPFGSDARFAVVLVSRYLWRPLLPILVAAVDPAGGVLCYETFAAGNERFGRPRNPDFLLRPDELLEAVRGRMTVLDYQHGVVGSGPERRVMQRLVAWKPGVPGELPPTPG